jgi:hypothetical protein
MAYSICGTDSNKRTYPHKEVYETLEEARKAAKVFFGLFRVDDAELEYVEILDADGAAVENVTAAHITAGDLNAQRS